ncbi:Fur family transcriptional regulator [Nitrospirota bacterium]
MIKMIDKFRSTGLKLTHQRASILEFLDSNTSHPTAHEVFEGVKMRSSTISFATVYNTLETMRTNGMVNLLTIDSGRGRYDPYTKEHHHMYCKVCGSVSDVSNDFDLVLPEQESAGFEVESTQIEFRGICNSCKT